MAERFTVRFKFDGREHETRVLVIPSSYLDDEVVAAKAAIVKAISRTACLECADPLDAKLGLEPEIGGHYANGSGKKLNGS